MYIQVVDGNGATISFTRSLLRYFGFFVPYLLGFDVSSKAKLTWPLAAIVQLFVVVASATLYLVMFNRRNRQGIHDLIARTYVAEYGLNTPPMKSSIWWPHWIIFGLLVILDFLLDRVMR